jgi:hypothetical protein
MNKPLHQPLALTAAQRAQIAAALATLRFAARDAFLLDLSSSLACCPQPLSDRGLKIAISDLLGIMPIKHFIVGDDQCN